MIRVLSILAALTLIACVPSPENKLDLSPQQTVPEPSLEKIAGGVWVHKSYKHIAPWGPVLSQGLLIDTGGGVALVDTAWTDEETETLLRLVEATLNQPPDMAIVTHAHDDKMGGMNALNKAGVGAHAHRLTNADAPARGLNPAQFVILDTADDVSFFGGSSGGDEREGPIKVYYPGPGHTRDNIVVYYEPAKVLFGGCLIRPGESNNLGNSADADIGHWAQAVRNVAERFPEAEIVVPSHGAAGGRKLLDHTIALAEAAANE